MLISRRDLVISLSAAAASVTAASRVLAAQNPASAPFPPPPPSPRTSPDPLVPEPSVPSPPGANLTKAMLDQNQRDIKKNVERLYHLASELKTEVEKTDATAVLSLPMLRKAEEIEKLAKQIRDRAKG